MRSTSGDVGRIGISAPVTVDGFVNWLTTRLINACLPRRRAGGLIELGMVVR